MKKKENKDFAEGVEEAIIELVKTGFIAFDFNGVGGELRIYLSDKFYDIKSIESKQRLIRLLEKGNLQ